ncbi:MAG: hypothetical protein Q9188_002714 [Gyalolechia gomerana]
MKRKVVDEALEEAKALGIRNILALRGDPPREEEYRQDTKNGQVEKEVKQNNEEFMWAIDLVRYIRQKYGDFFCIGVATYPEGHADESHPVEQSYGQDLPYLIEKIQAGAEFLVTQFFFDVNTYTRFEKMLREHKSGVFQKVPIIPGLLPIQNYRILKRTTKLAHCRIPPGLLETLEPVKADDEEVKRKGIDAICDIIREIQAIKSDRPRGFHFYTLNLEKVVGSILEKCELIPPLRPILSDKDPSAIDDSTAKPNGIRDTSSHSPNGVPQLRKPSDLPTSRRPSISSNHLTTTHRSSSPSQSTHLSTNQTISTASREATWDDYPNGRFGDARSPAFGIPTSYSPCSLPCTPAQARDLWGEPNSLSAITHLFASHLSGNSPSQLPWSDDSSPTLSPETTLIREHLLALTTSRNWWTIASQPAVDSLPSTDPIHGWGPAKGFVFQKPFVEFFCPVSDWHSSLRPYLQSPSIAPKVSYYAGHPSALFESSEKSEAVHAVTWGSFLGKEIATATMVEEVSFRAWCEEAFGRWEEWARYCRSGEARGFLRSCKEDLVLVNVIGHAYKEGEGGRLWEILKEAAKRERERVDGEKG